MIHAERFLSSFSNALDRIPASLIGEMVTALRRLRNRDGRLFVLGVGGSAANASHAVNDFRKLCNIEAYAPTDNASELTARTNDDGWAFVFSDYLRGSRLDASDALFVLSVGGGNAEKNVSTNLVRAIDYAKQVGAQVFGVVGRDGGYTGKRGDIVIVVPTVNEELVTPIAEAMQAVVWHAIVSHPGLSVQAAKWEGMAA